MLTVILTGGSSRRMGRDKALLPYGGGTLLQYLIDKYNAIGPVAVSVNVPGRFPFTGAAEIVDAYPGAGPLNGIISAFDAQDAPELFLTATDLPRGEAELALRLAQQRGNADACLLRWNSEKIEPLFAVYGRSCAAAARNCLAAGKRSFFDLLAGLNVRYVSPAELPELDTARILTNVNTPEDYARLD